MHVCARCSQRTGVAITFPSTINLHTEQSTSSLCNSAGVDGPDDITRWKAGVVIKDRMFSPSSPCPRSIARLRQCRWNVRVHRAHVNGPRSMGRHATRGVSATRAGSLFAITKHHMRYSTCTHAGNCGRAALVLRTSIAQSGWRRRRFAHSWASLYGCIKCFENSKAFVFRAWKIRWPSTPPVAPRLHCSNPTTGALPTSCVG